MKNTEANEAATIYPLGREQKRLLDKVVDALSGRDLSDKAIEKRLVQDDVFMELWNKDQLSEKTPQPDQKMLEGLKKAAVEYVSSELKELVMESKQTGPLPTFESFVAQRTNEAKKSCPKEAAAFKQYWVEFDRDLGEKGEHVFEFPNDDEGDKLQEKFLDEVGGAPHPLGGCRCVLAD